MFIGNSGSLALIPSIIILDPSPSRTPISQVNTCAGDSLKMEGYLPTPLIVRIRYYLLESCFITFNVVVQGFILKSLVQLVRSIIITVRVTKIII